MTTISIKYKGDLHCEAIHNQSGTGLVTDAPKDNHGRGESFHQQTWLQPHLAAAS